MCAVAQKGAGRCAPAALEQRKSWVFTGGRALNVAALALPAPSSPERCILLMEKRPNGRGDAGRGMTQVSPSTGRGRATIDPSARPEI